MKVNTQPVSAFAVYSEKLKQKKKKKENPKTQPSNGFKKVKKLQNSVTFNKSQKVTDKKTLQMKEIGFILQKLAERPTNTRVPRAPALLRSITVLNQKLGNNDNLKDTLKNVIEVENLRKKASALKRESRGKNSVNKSESADVVTSNLNTKTPPAVKILSYDDKNCSYDETGASFPVSHEEKLAASKPKDSKLKKTKVLLKKNSAVVSDGTVKEPKSVQKLKKRKIDDRLLIKSDKKGKGKSLKKPENSNTTEKILFDWLIVPVLEKDFMRDFWEKQPLLVQREGNRNYFSELLSSEVIDTMLRENNVCFTKHLDITSYTDGVRETHNLTGRAQANVVWDFYSMGCSVRLLNPQIFLPKIHALNATLQEYFGCFVGANVYLTPPNSQGFAPHYDDIEAFVLQIEGKKHWKVYAPRTDAEVLPRYSSPNFSQEEIGEPFLDVTLEPGDLLYFPRGFIHQASTVQGEHSLHITLSAYQKTAWVDLLEKLLPIALKRAAESDVEFRKGLPRDYLGLEYHGSQRDKQTFVDTAQTLIDKLKHYVDLSLGAGVDQMGSQFMHDALPPVLTAYEKEHSSVGGGLRLKNGKLDGRVEFQMNTCVKLLRFNICRLVEEEGEVRLYHCLDNSLEYHGDEPQFLVLPPEGVSVITHLQTSYPAFVPLRLIPHKDSEALVTLISDLWDSGLLSAKDLPVVEENE